MFGYVYLKIGEERDVACPFDGGEEEPGGQFAYVIDAHDIVGRLHALAVARRGIRFGSQQKRNVAGQVTVRSVQSAVVASQSAADADVAASADAVRQRQLTRKAGML